MNHPESQALSDESRRDFLAAVIAGLSLRQKQLPCQYLYDREGSRLFQQISQLEEYDLTRKEWQLLNTFAPDIATCIGPHATVIEPGSGEAEKIKVLLTALDAPVCYIPIDISREMLEASAVALRRAFPGVTIQPIIGDFNQLLTDSSWLPPQASAKTVLFFPGSTIGNYHPEEAIVLLKKMARVVGPDGGLLIGVDGIKAKETLLAAYNDSKGLTAAFNQNLLVRMNRELSANFDVAAFSHQAIYNHRKCRIEMHLVSQQPQWVTIDRYRFHFQAGETIHTENSYKYSPQEFTALGQEAGLQLVHCWPDAKCQFALFYWAVSAHCTAKVD